MEPGFYQLLEVLNNADKFSWKLGLYLPKGEAWGPETRCLVWDVEDSDDPDTDPARATENGLSFTLFLQDIQSIRENARQQRSNVSLEDLLSAFQYYYENDAFIDFRKMKR